MTSVGIGSEFFGYVDSVSMSVSLSEQGRMNNLSGSSEVSSYFSGWASELLGAHIIGRRSEKKLCQAVKWRSSSTLPPLSRVGLPQNPAFF